MGACLQNPGEFRLGDGLPNAARGASGRLDLKVGPVEGLEHDRDAALSGPFDRIFAINVVMFWKDPVKIMRTLGDRLDEEGRIYLTFQPRAGARSDEAVIAAAEKIGEQMRAAGLAHVRTETLTDLSPMAVCVIGAGMPGR